MESKIITTIEEVQSCLPVQMTSDFEVVDPFINNAERAHLKRLIGKEQLLVLITAYNDAGKNANEIADELMREAVKLSQKIVTTLGYYYALPILAVKIGSTGIQVFSNTDTKQAFNWQVDDVKAALINLGYGAIEDLLMHLDENPDAFPEYINSEQYIAAEQFLIESALDFNQYFNINRSRFIFQSISYLMLRIENQTVKKLFGTEFFESLKADNLEGKYKILANEYIKPGIALLTAAKAVVERVITFRDGVASINLVGNYDAAKSNIPAAKEDINRTKEQLEIDGNQFLQDGLAFIKDNLTDFEDFLSLVPKSQYNIKNNPDGGIYAI